MTTAFEAAVEDVRRRRAAVVATAAKLRQATSPLHLADEALRRLDPQFSFLRRVAARMRNNKLLSLAILAGAGWLAGPPRHPDGEAPAARKAGTATPRANLKEKNNDSGRKHRKPRPGPGQHRQEPRPKGLAQARHHDAGQAQPDVGSLEPLRREPQHERVAGPRDQARSAVRPQFRAGQQRDSLPQPLDALVGADRQQF